MNLPFFVWLLLSTIWGSTWLVIKIGLEDLSPLSFAGLHFVIAVILGRIVLGEMLNWRTTIGGISILSGLALLSWGHKLVQQSECFKEEADLSS